MILGIGCIVNKLTSKQFTLCPVYSSSSIKVAPWTLGQCGGEEEGNSSSTLTSALPSTLHIHYPLNSTHSLTILQMAMKIAEQNIPTDMLECRTRPVLCPVSVNLQSGSYFLSLISACMKIDSVSIQRIPKNIFF